MHLKWWKRQRCFKMSNWTKKKNLQGKVNGYLCINNLWLFSLLMFEMKGRLMFFFRFSCTYVLNKIPSQMKVTVFVCFSSHKFKMEQHTKMVAWFAITLKWARLWPRFVLLKHAFEIVVDSWIEHGIPMKWKLIVKLAISWKWLR